ACSYKSACPACAFDNRPRRPYGLERTKMERSNRGRSATTAGGSTRMHQDYAASLPVIETDVLVAGGGCAGFGAAVAAARTGARTLMVERAGFVGGILTSVRNPWFDGIAHLGPGKVGLAGLPFEVLIRLGLATPDTTHLDHPFLPLDPERFKHLADR